MNNKNVVLLTEDDLFTCSYCIGLYIKPMQRHDGGKMYDLEISRLQKIKDKIDTLLPESGKSVYPWISYDDTYEIIRHTNKID